MLDRQEPDEAPLIWLANQKTIDATLNQLDRLAEAAGETERQTVHLAAAWLLRHSRDVGDAHYALEVAWRRTIAWNLGTEIADATDDPNTAPPASPNENAPLATQVGDQAKQYGFIWRQIEKR